MERRRTLALVASIEGLVIALIAVASFARVATAQQTTNPVLTAQVVSADEATGQAIIELRLNRSVDREIRVGYRTVAGTASSGGDFQERAASVVFPVGVRLRRISIVLVKDLVAEPEQDFFVNFTAERLVLRPASLRVVIRDDDPDPILSLRPASVVEGSGGGATQYTVTARLSIRSEKNISFNLTAAPGTASRFEFISINRVIQIPAGEIQKPVRLSVVADDDFEGKQQFYVVAGLPQNVRLNPSQYVPGATDRIRSEVSLYDDDVLTPPPQVMADRTFHWIGNFERTFTDDELNAIAMNSDLVVIEKFHAFYNSEIHQSEASKLLQRKPNLKIFAYMSSKYWFPVSEWGVEPDTQWYLRDMNGKVIEPVLRTPAVYLDLRIPACREWIITTIESWLATGVYAGVAFDSAGKIGDFSGGTYWQEALGAQGIEDWNNGLSSLLADTKARLGTQLVLFNGIAVDRNSAPTRGIEHLAYTDGTMTERFAIGADGSTSPTLLADIELMRTNRDRFLLMKANLKDDRNLPLQERTARFSYGSFLMGWVPGKSFFKFASDDFYTSAELEDNPIETQRPTGNPLGDYRLAGTLLYRQFDKALVIVNPTDAAQNFTELGQSISVPAADAVFIFSD